MSVFSDWKNRTSHDSPLSGRSESPSRGIGRQKEPVVFEVNTNGVLAEQVHHVGRPMSSGSERNESVVVGFGVLHREGHGRPVFLGRCSIARLCRGDQFAAAA